VNDVVIIYLFLMLFLLQRYEVIDTEDIPHLENSKFSSQVVNQFSTVIKHGHKIQFYMALHIHASVCVVCVSLCVYTHVHVYVCTTV